MREILFRGKRTNGEFVEGYFYEDTRGVYILQSIPQKIRNEGTGAIRVWDEQVPFEVDPPTVGQYTGVTDKNGKKIFEGDFIRIDEYVKEIFDPVNDGPVIFSRGCFFVGDGSSALQSLDTICDCEGEFRGEVIGNIYENPELLKGGEEG